MDAARVEVQNFKKDGSPAKKPGVWYRCMKCGTLGKEVVSKANKNGHIRIWLDHKEPVVPLDRYPDWREYIERLFCDPNNFEVLCDICHKDKSMAENMIRKANRNAKV
jgi:hypothetical protein